MANLAYDEHFLSLLPSKWWVKFFKKFAQIEDLPISKWKPVHLLAYFSQRYQDHFGVRFSFSLKGQPSKCTEIYLIKQVIPILGTDDPKIYKEYIDWVFDEKIIPLKRKIRSVGFLINSQFCNEFWLDRSKREEIHRDTHIPPEYEQVVKELDLPIQTFGDLAFAKQAFDQSSQDRGLYEDLFNKLFSVGFEFRMIEGLR